MTAAPLHRGLRDDPVQPWRLRADWAVAQRCDHPEPGAANAIALLDLEGGADALTLVARAGHGSRGWGLPSPETVAPALAAVELDLIALRLDAGAGTPAFAGAIAAIVSAKRLDAAAPAIDLAYDPIAIEARSGRAPEPGSAARLVAFATDAGFGGAPLAADGRVWHDAGASDALELGLVLATATAHLRTLEAAGLSLDAARRALATVLSFDADIATGIAKARAMRRLWARLEAACGVEPAPLRLHGETSWRMMTRHDPWTNAMRATAAAFAAGLGGVDTLCVLPMTLVRGLPDAAARRLARNTSRILLDESGLSAVDDAAAGSGALEARTGDLCRDAWSEFQAIERRGGIAAAMRDGTLGDRLTGDIEERRAEIAGLARGIVGTSRYPSLDPPAPPVLDISRPPAPSADGIAAVHRDAEPFETLRDRAERAASRPRVALVTLGEPAAHGPRAALATQLFAAAGIATTSDEADAIVACLCGDDAAYAAKGAETVTALREAGVKQVFVLDGEAGDALALRARGASVLPALERALDALAL